MQHRNTKATIIAGLAAFFVWPLIMLALVDVLDWICVSYVFYEFGTYVFSVIFVAIGLALAFAEWFLGEKRGLILGSLVLLGTAGWVYSESRIYRTNADFGEDAVVCYTPYPFRTPFRSAECSRIRQKLQTQTR